MTGLSANSKIEISATFSNGEPIMTQRDILLVAGIVAGMFVYDRFLRSVIANII